MTKPHSFLQRRTLLSLAAAATLTLAGCGKPWTVVEQAAPNPLIGQQQFTVQPIDFTGLAVGEKSEEGYLAENDEEARSNWAGDKAAMTDELVSKMRQTAGEAGIQISRGTDGPFVVAPKVAWMEPGYYAVVAARPSEVQMTVQILQDGQVIDEIQLSHSTAASMTNPAVGNRLRDDAEALGAYVGEYLIERTHPGEG